MDVRRASCRKNYDPDRWFPISARAAELDDLPQAVCAMCPIQADCLAKALDEDIRSGTWGGYTEWQRERMKVDARYRTQVLREMANAAGSETPLGVG
jgi:hypothetical protein